LYLLHDNVKSTFNKIRCSALVNLCEVGASVNQSPMRNQMIVSAFESVPINFPFHVFSFTTKGDSSLCQINVKINQDDLHCVSTEINSVKEG
ncbi:hypothetical protein STEG23_015766, partial [Scotinomys teguina]